MSLGLLMTDTLVVKKRKTTTAGARQRTHRVRRDPRGTVLAQEAYAAGHEAHRQAHEQGFEVTVFVDGVLHVLQPDGTTRPFASTPASGLASAEDLGPQPE